MFSSERAVRYAMSLSCSISASRLNGLRRSCSSTVRLSRPGSKSAALERFMRFIPRRARRALSQSMMREMLALAAAMAPAISTIQGPRMRRFIGTPSASRSASLRHELPFSTLLRLPNQARHTSDLYSYS